MRPEQWQTFRNAAKRKAPTSPPAVALIVDSPWIPGYLGISHLDYYFDPDTWYTANLRIASEFPDVILFPSWWVEYGMAIEPSALGTRIHFWPDQTPGQSPILFNAADIERFAPINPHTDGMMPMALRQYGALKQRIFDAGYTIPVVTARGPLCTAAFVRGLSEFMMDLVDHSAAAHKLIRFCTETTIRWLQAQAETVGPCVEGIFVLDDIPGFLSRQMYLEFAHPYLRQICESFPRDWVKVYHNDAKTRPFLADLPDTGFDVLNFSYNVDIGEARAATAGRMCLMGNVNPLDLGVRGSAAQVKAAALEVLRKTNAEGMILSLGGGASPGMPCENVLALAEAAREFCPAASAPVEARSAHAAEVTSDEARDLYGAIVTGNAAMASDLTRAALDGGADPYDLVTCHMIPAMEEVGRRFEREQYFVPELLLSARAMKAALVLLRPLLAAAGAQPAGRVAIGTVKGDVHDIGKNLVASMLEGGGFEVLDLGVDVPPEKFVAAVTEQHVDILCMSALLTVTMRAMKGTMDALRKEGVRDQVKVLVGGAPVTDAFASEIGADSYGRDARAAVAQARELMTARRLLL